MLISHSMYLCILTLPLTSQVAGKLWKFNWKNVLGSSHLIKPLIELLIQLHNERPVSIHLLMLHYLHLADNHALPLCLWVWWTVRITKYSCSLETRTYLGMSWLGFVGVGYREWISIVGIIGIGYRKRNRKAVGSDDKSKSMSMSVVYGCVLPRPLSWLMAVWWKGIQGSL